MLITNITLKTYKKLNIHINVRIFQFLWNFDHLFIHYWIFFVLFSNLYLRNFSVSIHDSIRLIELSKNLYITKKGDRRFRIYAPQSSYRKRVSATKWSKYGIFNIVSYIKFIRTLKQKKLKKLKVLSTPYYHGIKEIKILHMGKKQGD